MVAALSDYARQKIRSISTSLARNGAHGLFYRHRPHLKAMKNRPVTIGQQAVPIHVISLGQTGWTNASHPSNIMTATQQFWSLVAQAGLSIAARLTQLGIDTLIVDKNSRVGDNWRNRYHALTLHNQLHVNHLPYVPFPPTWPTYIPKDMLALWFESYAAIMELNFWTDTEVTAGTYDENSKLWDIALTIKDGRTRHIAPRHVVLATGVSGIANLPEIPTLNAFAGPVCIPAAIKMVMTGLAKTPLSLAVVIAAMTFRKIYIQVAPMSLWCSAAQVWL